MFQVAQRKLQALGAEDQMVRAIEEQQDQPFFLHTLLLEDKVKYSLAKASKLVKDKPCLILTESNLEVKGKSVVPPSMVSEDFDAEKWLKEVAEALEGQVKAPKGQDCKLHCNLLAVKIKRKEDLLSAALRGQSYAERFIPAKKDP